MTGRIATALSDPMGLNPKNEGLGPFDKTIGKVVRVALRFFSAALFGKLALMGVYLHLGGAGIKTVLGFAKGSIRYMGSKLTRKPLSLKESFKNSYFWEAKEHGKCALRDTVAVLAAITKIDLLFYAFFPTDMTLFFNPYYRSDDSLLYRNVVILVCPPDTAEISLAIQ